MKELTNKNILIADKIHSAGVSLLRKNNFKIFTGYNLQGYKLIGKAAVLNAGILIIRSARKLDKKFISKLSNQTDIKLLCTASSGTDHIDVSYAKKSGISVLNVPEGNYISAAEHTFSLILASAKNLIKYDKLIRQGIFDNSKYANFELYGKTIGIIGVGHVGSYVARIAKSFNMKILGNDIKKSLKSKYKWIKFTGVKKLLRSSDIVTLHVPLDESTINLISYEELKNIKEGAVFINCARGGIVNEHALLGCLKRREKKIFYAGLDVFKDEPMDKHAEFKMGKQFSKLSNVILTPHIAGKTQESIERISILLAKSIINTPVS